MKQTRLCSQVDLNSLKNNTATKCIFRCFSCACVVSCFSHIQFFATPWTIQPARLRCPWESPGKNTGLGCHFLLQGIFLTQGSNPSSYVSCIGRWVLYHQHHLGSHVSHFSNVFLFCFFMKLSCNSLTKSKYLNLLLLLHYHQFIIFLKISEVWGNDSK